MRHDHRSGYTHSWADIAHELSISRAFSTCRYSAVHRARDLFLKYSREYWTDGSDQDNGILAQSWRVEYCEAQKRGHLYNFVRPRDVYEALIEEIGFSCLICQELSRLNEEPGGNLLALGFGDPLASNCGFLLVCAVCRDEFFDFLHKHFTGRRGSAHDDEIGLAWLAYKIIQRMVAAKLVPVARLSFPKRDLSSDWTRDELDDLVDSSCIKVGLRPPRRRKRK